MSFTRYAAYHLPAGDLGDFGAAWLGWDVRQGVLLPHPQFSDLPGSADDLTAVPRRYGFHATMKAPFRLTEGASVDDLSRELAQIARKAVPFAMPLDLAHAWGFLFLRPTDPPPQLAALEAALVRDLDRFRAPLSDADLARRNPDRLSPEEREMLMRWGYPNVLDRFRYHLTLSGPLAEDELRQLEAAIRREITRLLAAPMPVSQIALVGERPDGHFELIEEFTLNG